MRRFLSSKRSPRSWLNAAFGVTAATIRRGALSLETFETLLSGGKTGAEIVPGSLEKSRLVGVVGEQNPFKMPPGDAFIKRAHWNSLRTWILEGAKYDGGDARSRCASLVPRESERRMAELAHTLAAGASRAARSERAKSSGGVLCPRRAADGRERGIDRLRETCRPNGSSRSPSWAAAAVQAAQAFYDDHAQPLQGGTGGLRDEGPLLLRGILPDGRTPRASGGDPRPCGRDARFAGCLCRRAGSCGCLAAVRPARGRNSRSRSVRPS